MRISLMQQWGGIIHNLSRLQELGLLKRIGGRKQGYWEIIEE